LKFRKFLRYNIKEPFNMPRSFTAGNGEMLVGIDEHGLLQDLYYPQIGQENHVGDEHQHRVGVFVDGAMHWLSDKGFTVSATTNPETMESQISARNASIGVTITIKDVVYNEKPIFIREVTVRNNWDVARDITLYFCQEFEISQSRQASTAYFDPANQCLIHYRGRRAFLINAVDDDGSFTQYTTGVSGIENKEGSWRDAEDGNLQGNPIEHGPADSCMGFERSYAAKDERTTYLWMTAGKSIKEVVELNQYVHDHTPQHISQTTSNYWRAWLERCPDHYHDLSDEAQDLFSRSLLVIRAHADKKGGILASSDSDMLQRGKDSYEYVWPRDGSYITRALDQVGAWKVSERFFYFMNDALTSEGYLMHKYGPDGSLRSSWHPWFYDGMYQLPIQEDETATVLHTLWEHYEESQDLEFIENIYNSFIEPAANFLISYRHHETKLPKRSYDLWEERISVHTYTASSVYGGLKAASNFAQLLGKEVEAKHYRSKANEVKDAILKYLYEEDEGYFVRSGDTENDSFVQDTTVDFSSAFGIWYFGVLPPRDERLVNSMALTQESLGVLGVGGFARYEGDTYYRDKNNDGVTAPGNPWFVTTLWYAQYVIELADNEEEIKQVEHILEWVTENTTPSGLLSEQLDLKTGVPLSATPLIWSHGEFVITVVKYLEKLDELGICRNCKKS